MSYSVTCECGSRHAVSATQAGSMLECACGRSVDVPLLSALRKSAGESPIPLNTIERIRAMIQSGELPNGDICPYSGRPANSTIYFHVQCERSWVRGGDSWDTGKVIAYVLLFGWIGALIASKKSQPMEEIGRDTFLELPLRMSSDVASSVMRIRRQKKLKMLLRQTPIYARLLDESPEADVSPLRIV